MNSALARLFVEIGSQTKGLDTGLDESRGKLRTFGGFAQTLLAGVASGVTQAALSAAAGLAAGMGATLRQWVKDAGDLNETLSKSEVVFGAANGRVLGFAASMRQQYGTVTREIVDAASSFGLIFKGAQIAEGESARLSIALATAADDAASLFNSELPEALEKIRAGLVGEAEPLRAYGVMLNEASVQQEALRLGLAKNKDQLTEQAKIMARASLIQKGLAVASGDHARTQAGMNNQMKEFADRMKTLGATIGSWFVGPMAFALRIVNAGVGALTAFADAIGGVVGRMLTWGASAKQTAGDVEKLNAAAAEGGAAAKEAPPAAAPAADRKAFDARKEILEEEEKAREDKAKDVERERRAAELAAERRKREDFAVGKAIGFRNFGDDTPDKVEHSRRNFNGDQVRQFNQRVASAAMAALRTGGGMAAALREAGVGALGDVAGALGKQAPKAAHSYGVTDAEGYYREVQDAAANGAGRTQEEIKKELEKHTTKLDELIRAFRRGLGGAVGVFG